MRMSGALFLVGAALAVASACESFDAAQDGVPPSSDASIFDASIADAPGDREAGPPCPLGAFCDDFERQGRAEQGWTSASIAPGNELTIVDDERGAGGRALAVSLAASGTDGRYAHLVWKLDTPSSSARLSFAFRVVTPPTDDVLVARLQIGDEGFAYAMLRDGALSFTAQRPLPDGGLLGEEAGSPSARLGTAWHSVTLEYRAGTTSLLSLSVDEVTATIDVKNVVAAVRAIAIGSTYARSGDAARLHFDDVRFETTF